MTADFSRTLPADEAALPPLIEAIEIWLNTAGAPAGEIARLMIAFDELLSNIIRHGGGTIYVTIRLADGAIRAIITDDGPPFDPLARPAPDIDLDIDERAIGGLGIQLVLDMMDEVEYTYQDGRNRLTIGKTF